MECMHCQHLNPEGSKFCGSCGKSFYARCPQCSHENTPGSKFCNKCGQVLEDPQAVGTPDIDVGEEYRGDVGERRQATVLFSDLSGYTRLNERLDPEEVEQIVNQIKVEAVRIIEFHGGTVNRFVGDEIMALFGIPDAHEDDPVRATKAALALHDVVRRMDSELNVPVGQQLTMHSGINSGLIVTHSRNDLEGPYAVTGDSVNIGARLRSLAAADEILVGPEIQCSIAPYIETEALEPVKVKGKTKTLVPYRVIGESDIQSRFEAAERRGFTKYTGRDLEIATLKASWEKVIQGEAQFITVEGEAGVGKSRLLYEFRRSLDRSQLTISQGRCQPYGSDTPYLPFIDSLRRGLQLSDDDSGTELLDKVVARINEVDSSLEQYIPLYLQLLSIKSDHALPENLQARDVPQAMQEALGAITMRIAQHRPMILILEDWHWSDEASTATLKHLIGVIVPYPVMIIVTHRPEYPLNWGHLSYHTNIFLRPLNTVHTAEIVKSIMHAEQLPEGLATLVHERTGGNPLFIEETCNSLIESETIVVKDSQATLIQPLTTLTLPGSVQAIIRTRLDRLDNDAKEAVLLAAAIGRAFPQQILEQLYSAQASLTDLLESLKAQEIIQQVRVDPEPEYIFKHILTREVAYETILLKQRTKLHTAIGQAMERCYSSRLEEHTAVLAYHYLRSVRHDKATEYALLAGDKAMKLYASAEAITYYKEALEAARRLPASPARQRCEIDAILKLVAVESSHKDITEDRLNLQAALETAEGLNDERRMAQILYWLGRIHYVLAELRPVISFAERSLEIADRLGDETLAAPAVNLMGRTYWQLSDFVRSAQMTERSIEQMQRLGNKTEQSTAAGFAGALFGYIGDFERALSHADHSIQLAKEIENPFAEAANYHYRGIIRDQLGEWERAIVDYEQAQSIADKAGDVFRVYLVKFMAGRAHTIRGDLVRALQLLEESIGLAEKIRTKFLIGQAKAFLAECLIARTDFEMAESLCRGAIEVAVEAGDKFSSALAHRALAESLSTARTMDTSEAEYFLTRAIQMLEEIGAKPELARTCLSYARLLHARSKKEKASKYLSRAIGQFDELGMAWDIRQAEKLLREI